MTDNTPYASTLWRFGLLAALFLLCLGRPVAARTLHRYRMPIGAFLRRPAPTGSALTRQLTDDKLVCIRYARLFNMSPPMVRRAFRRLRLTCLKQDRVLQVFYIRSGERIGYRLRRVRKGTRVYVLPDGTPLLLRVCGNPIHKVLSTKRRAPLFSVPEYAPYEPLPAITFSTEAAPLLRPAVPPDFVEVTVPAPNEVPVATKTRLSNWAWGIVPIIIGGVGATEGSSGGPLPIPSPGPPPILPPAPQPRPGPPVPENSTAILMVTAGAMGLLLFQCFRRNRMVP